MNPSRLLFSLLLFWTLPAGAQSIIDPWQTQTPRIHVTADPIRQTHEARISPGRGLLIIFDAPVQQEGLNLEGREHFRQVSLSEDGLLLSLLPRKELSLGMRLGLTARFADGKEPTQAALTLVVSPQSPAQVEVHRETRPIEPTPEDSEATQAKLQQCQKQLEESLARRAPQSGLLGLLALNRLGQAGVKSASLLPEFVLSPREDFRLFEAIAYRATGGDPKVPVMRLAVELRLKNVGATPWRPLRARLVGPDGAWEAEVWTPEPIAPGATRRVLVETERPGSRAPGAYRLMFWDEEGIQGVTLSGVTFP